VTIFSKRARKSLKKKQRKGCTKETGPRDASLKFKKNVGENALIARKKKTRGGSPKKKWPNKVPAKVVRETGEKYRSRRGEKKPAEQGR